MSKDDGEKQDNALAARRARLRSSLTTQALSPTGNVLALPEDESEAAVPISVSAAPEPLPIKEQTDVQALELLGNIDQALSSCATHLASLQKVASKQIDELKGIADTLQHQSVTEVGLNINTLMESLTAAIEPMKAIGELVPALDRLVSVSTLKNEPVARTQLNEQQLVLSLAQQLATGAIDDSTFKSAYQAVFPNYDLNGLMHQLSELLGEQQLSGELFQVTFKALQHGQIPAVAGNRTSDSNDESSSQREAELQTRIVEKEQELEEVKKRLEQRWQELNGAYEDLYSTVQTRDSALRQKEDELSQKNAELVAKDSENQQLRTQMQELKEQPEDIQHWQELNETNEKLNKTNEELNKNNEEMNRAYDESSRAFEELNKAFEELRSTVQQRENILREKDDELNEKTAELVAKDSENQQLRAQMEELRDQTKEMVTDLQKQLAQKQADEKAMRTAKTKAAAAQPGFFELFANSPTAAGNDRDENSNTGTVPNTVNQAVQPNIAANPASTTQSVQPNTVVSPAFNSQPVQPNIVATPISVTQPLQANTVATPTPAFNSPAPAGVGDRDIRQQPMSDSQPTASQPNFANPTASFVSAAGSYGSGVRAQVFEVIVRQALAGAHWREICAVPMQINNISPEEVESEVKRRQALLKK